MYVGGKDPPQFRPYLFLFFLSLGVYLPLSYLSAIIGKRKSPLPLKPAVFFRVPMFSDSQLPSPPLRPPSSVSQLSSSSKGEKKRKKRASILCTPSFWRQRHSRPTHGPTDRGGGGKATNLAASIHSPLLQKAPYTCTQPTNPGPPSLLLHHLLLLSHQKATNTINARVRRRRRRWWPLHIFSPRHSGGSRGEREPPSSLQLSSSSCVCIREKRCCVRSTR